MKVSVSIPDEDIDYLEAEIAAGRYPSRSAAFHAAIKSLRRRDLESQYAEAGRQWVESGDQVVWDVTLADGLDASAW